MGSTKIKAPERDYAEEYEQNLLTQLKYADKLYESEATYQPKYADLQFNMAKNLTPKVMDLYQNEIYPRMAEMDRAATEQSRLSDVESIEKYGGRMVSALESANPEEAAMKKELNRQAMGELALGGKLTGHQRRALTQSVREGQAARGFGHGLNDQAMETLAEMNAMEDRRRERQNFAQGQLGLSSSLTADPMMAVLGRSSRGYNPAQALGQAGGYRGGSIFNPESGYAGGLHGQNASMLMQARSQNAQMNADMIGGAMGAIGGIAGGFCWVAREVYGADDPRWTAFRSWMLWEAPVWFFKLYSKVGERFASFVSNKPKLKGAIRWWMNTKIKEN
jgi:hypothetical protein